MCPSVTPPLGPGCDEHELGWTPLAIRGTLKGAKRKSSGWVEIIPITPPIPVRPQHSRDVSNWTGFNKRSVY